MIEIKNYEVSFSIPRSFLEDLGLKGSGANNPKYQSPWYNLTFSVSDIYNIPIGFVLGAMGAIQSRSSNYYCSKNTTAAQIDLNLMMINFKNNQPTSGMQYLYAAMQLFGNIAISCTQSLLQVYVPDLFYGPDNAYPGQQFLLNILYNLGFQITDILNLVFYDTTITQPFWYYVSYQLGDFAIRFIYRDINA